MLHFILHMSVHIYFEFSCFVGVSGTFSPINATAFSPTRPMVFAAATGDGFLYVYDLNANELSPVATLECPLEPPASSEDSSNAQTTAGAAAGSASGKHKKTTQKRSSVSESTHNRVTITGLAFNPKQRGLVAACDYLGRVHIWKLSWKLSNLAAGEQAGLEGIAGIYAASSDAHQTGTS